MHRTFVYSSVFARQWERAGFSDEDLTELERAIMTDPTGSPIIEGTGGVRKLRWARPGSGKSGGVRIFFLDLERFGITHILVLIAKNEKANLSKAQRNELAEIVQVLKTSWNNNLKKPPLH